MLVYSLASNMHDVVSSLDNVGRKFKKFCNVDNTPLAKWATE
jgi:hypothetical protein